MTTLYCTVKKNAKFDFGVAMLPAKKRRGTPTGGGNFYIFKKSSAAEKKASMRLIKFMTSPEQAAHWSMSTGYMGRFKKGYQLQGYDYPINTISPSAGDTITSSFGIILTGSLKK